MRFGTGAAAAAVILLGLTGVGWDEAKAQDALRSSYMAACAEDFQDLNPIWSEQQVATMCGCHFGHLTESFGEDDIANLIRGMETDTLIEVREPVTTAHNEFVQTCFDALK